MSPFAIILLIIAAFMHAGWNLLSKSQRPSAAFFLLASVAGGLFLLPVLLWHADKVAAIAPGVWLLIALTGMCQAGYYCGLAGAYRHGDMSIAYPLARSSPVIVVTIATLVLGRVDDISRQCIVGIFLVVAGCFVLPMKRFNDFSLKNYLNLTCVLALVAAFGTAGYSMLDDEALRQLRGLASNSSSTVATTFVYACLEALSCSAWLLLYVLALPGERAALRKTLATGKRPAVFTGVMIYVTYSIVLISMAFVSNISYVVGFRQLSIPLGAVLGIVVLKEAPHLPKMVGVCIMFVGLILIGAG